MSMKRISLKNEAILQEHCNYLEFMIDKKQIDMFYQHTVTFLYCTVNSYLANCSMGLEVYLDRLTGKKLSMCCYALNEAIANDCFDNKTANVLKELIEFVSEKWGIIYVC